MLALIAAVVSLAVLTPLAVAKRRLGEQISSRALQGDGALSGIGAATGFLALAGLVLYDALGWWWADRVAALVIAAIAAAQAWRTAPRGTVIAGALGAVSPPVAAPGPRLPPVGDRE
ncbi:MAG TPA: hypothetical protein VF204_08705 [Streptosporangiaceae bacterium]